MSWAHKTIKLARASFNFSAKLETAFVTRYFDATLPVSTPKFNAVTQPEARGLTFGRSRLYVYTDVDVKMYKN